MYVMMMVWMLQGGTLQGSPWQSFNTVEACEAAIDTRMKSEWNDRFLFASGCLHRDTMKNFRAYHFKLLPQTQP